MEGTATIFLDGLKVFFRAIPLVLGEIVLRVLIMVGNHQSVAGDFGHDGCGGDAEASLVTFGDGLLREGEAERLDSIDQKEIRRLRKFFYRQLHRFQGSLKDVDAVDLFDLNDPDAHGQSLLAQKRKHLFSLCGR